MNALFAEASKFSSFDFLMKDVHLLFSPVTNSRFWGGRCLGGGGRGGKGKTCHLGLLGRVIILLVTSYYSIKPGHAVAVCYICGSCETLPLPCLAKNLSFPI